MPALSEQTAAGWISCRHQNLRVFSHVTYLGMCRSKFNRTCSHPASEYNKHTATPYSVAHRRYWETDLVGPEYQSCSIPNLDGGMLAESRRVLWQTRPDEIYAVKAFTSWLPTIHGRTRKQRSKVKGR